ncbi:MAG: hypothetical protein ACODUE_01440 [Synechococcus sp.]
MASSGPLAERVTVTMPAELVAGIDRVERNRSRFIDEADPKADSDLLDPNAGTPLTWRADVGWVSETDGIQP